MPETRGLRRERIGTRLPSLRMTVAPHLLDVAQNVLPQRPEAPAEAIEENRELVDDGLGLVRGKLGDAEAQKPQV